MKKNMVLIAVLVFSVGAYGLWTYYSSQDRDVSQSGQIVRFENEGYQYNIFSDWIVGPDKENSGRVWDPEMKCAVMTGFLKEYGEYDQFMANDFDEYLEYSGGAIEPSYVNDFKLQEMYEGKKIVTEYDGQIISVSALVNINKSVFSVYSYNEGCVGYSAEQVFDQVSETLVFD